MNDGNIIKDTGMGNTLGSAFDMKWAQGLANKRQNPTGS